MTDPPSPARAEKAELRERFQAYREGLSQKEYAHRSRQIAERLAALPEIRAAQVVLGYWPLVESGEVDTRPLVERLHAEGRTVALPVVTSFEAGAPAMVARRYAGRAGLRENRWGLSEPVGTAPLAPETLEAIVVPALGAGRDGYRLGHGSGFYDAFLPKTDAAAICLVYDACLPEHVPAEAHDARMNVVVTETQVLRPAM